MTKKSVFIAFVLLSSLPIIAKAAPKDTLRKSTSEVIVTSTRYPERYIEAPLSMSIIDRSEIFANTNYGIESAFTSVPGVLFQTRSGNQDARLTIRGFGARGAGDRSNSGTSRGVKILLDGFPETEPDGRTAFDNLDMDLAEHMEIIRSNSSAVWGNAAGGIIAISSMPDRSGYFADLSLLGGSFGLQKYTLKAGAPLPSGKFVLTAINSKFDGWRKHSESERTILNGGIFTALSPGTTLETYVLATQNKFDIPGPLTQAQFDAEPEQANAKYAAQRERRLNRLMRLGVTLNHEIGDKSFLTGSVYLNPKYLQRSERNTYRDFTRYHVGGSASYHTEFNWNENVRNAFLTGLDESYQDGAILFYELDSLQGRSNKLTSDKKEGASSFGIFAQDEVFWGDVSLTLGARYDAVTYYSADFLLSHRSDKRTFDRVSPKIGFTYLISRGHSLYFNYGSGIEVPAGNETDPPSKFGLQDTFLLSPLLDPIVSTTYEIGTKRSLTYDGFLRNLDYNSAIYLIDTKNELVPYNGGRYYFAAGLTRRIGFELGLKTIFKYGLAFDGSISISNNKYEDYKIDSMYSDFADYTDNELAGVPSLYYGVKLGYQPDFFSYVRLEAELRGIGEYFADDANRFSVPSFNVINLKFGTAEPIDFGAVSLGVFVALNNVTDEKYVASAFINPDLDKQGNPFYLEPGLPQNVAMGLTIGF